MLSKITPSNIIGIDLGIKDLIVTSDGEKYSNPKEVLKRLKRKFSRQESGSNNYYKTKNSRKHNIINIVNKIVKEHDIIVSEN